jgi:hypothetical protein
LEADPEINQPVDSNGTRGTGKRASLAGWGGPRADSTPYDNELRIRSEAFASGIGALANSRLEIRTARQFKQFSARVGLDDSTLERSTKVRFEVYGDGRLLAQSPRLSFADPAFALQATITGVRTVELVARELVGGRAPTIVTWAKAALMY